MQRRVNGASGMGVATHEGLFAHAAFCGSPHETLTVATLASGIVFVGMGNEHVPASSFGVETNTKPELAIVMQLPGIVNEPWKTAPPVQPDWAYVETSDVHVAP